MFLEFHPEILQREMLAEENLVINQINAQKY